MGVGRASGKDKAEIAANMAISSPLLETAINGARGVIINVTASPDIGLDEIETASSLIAQQADENANIIWGAAFDETMDDEISVTVIATGFETRGSYFPVSPQSKASAPASERERPVSNPVNYSRPAAQPEAKEESDSFYDIMSLFKEKK